MNATLAAILVYLVAQLALGIWISRRIGTEADYLLAGRKLGYGLATFSLFATWFGAETVMSGAGRAYETGFSWATPEPFGYGLCLLGMGLVFAGPLWKRKLTTLADLFRQRYSVRVERLAALILVPSSVLWAAAQIRAFGHVVSSAAPELPIDFAVGLAAGFALLYTAFGGLLADAITDLAQGILVILGLLLVAIMTVMAVGGFDGIDQALQRATQFRVDRSETLNTSYIEVAEAWAIPVFGSVLATELVGRIVGTRSASVARNSGVMAGLLYIAVGSLPLLIGLLGANIVGQLPDSEQLVPSVARAVLPGALYALFAGGLISAILSTVDSTLLVASGLLSHNIVVPVWNVTKEHFKVRIARGGVLLLGMVAWMLARSAEGVFELVEQASALGSAGVLVTVCFALFTRFGGPRAAASTLVAGVAVYLGAGAIGSAAPFLFSLAVAFVTYVLVATLEKH